MDIPRDQYIGFGRVIDSRWVKSSTDIERIKYGYNAASNQVWRQNPVGSGLDQFYTNDGLYQLTDLDRGMLNGTKTGITSPNWEEDFTYDLTGNWDNEADEVTATSCQR